VVAKIGPGVSDEAGGLLALGSFDGGVSVPSVLVSGPDLLVTTWIDQEPRTPAHDERLGRELAALHSSALRSWGGGSSWIGSCRIDPAARADGPAFYRARLNDLAKRCGLERSVEPVADSMADLAPFGRPAALHGDLWWGNVLWGTGGTPWLVDPSFHGGHPEEDLGMLALFGAVSDRLLAAYLEIHPLDDGWQERVELWQLYPLLVHTILFGGGYRAQAEAVARRYGRQT
jgi:fructosamine-3-kinase